MKKTKILFEGHDLKFLSHIIAHYQANRAYDVEVFTYAGHEIKDLTEIHRILPEIDIIFCEWGLGNLRWFSQNKLPGQKIITRIHSQEFFTGYLQETHWSQVTKIVFVSRHMMEKFQQLFPGSSAKCVMIHNMVDSGSYDLPKTEDARFHLGLLGVLPRLKAPHLALEIFNELRRADPRYKLFIKSRKPQEVDWLWKKEEERRYYEELFDLVAKYSLEESVIWEVYGSDVPEWFRKIGFVLSCSDREAFHMAVAEGMAAGTIPVIRNWEGARELFPRGYSFENAGEAVELIRKFSDRKKFDDEQGALKQYCREHFDVKVIIPAYDKLMFPEYDVADVRREYYHVSEESRKLAADLLVCSKARDKAAEDMGHLIGQQKSLVETNSALARDITAIRQELTKYQETNNQRAAALQGLQQEYASMQGTLARQLSDASRITLEVQAQANQNNSLREEIVRLEHENLGQKEALAEATMENQSTRESLTAENVLLKETLEQQIVHILETSARENTLVKETLEQQVVHIRETSARENSLIRELLDKEIARLTHELSFRVSENAALIRKYDYERSRLQGRMDEMKIINLDLERRLIQTFSSTTWKVGAILVKKPVDLLRGLKNKELPSK